MHGLDDKSMSLNQCDGNKWARGRNPTRARCVCTYFCCLVSVLSSLNKGWHLVIHWWPKHRTSAECTSYAEELVGGEYFMVETSLKIPLIACSDMKILSKKLFLNLKRVIW